MRRESGLSRPHGSGVVSHERLLTVSTETDGVGENPWDATRPLPTCTSAPVRRNRPVKHDSRKDPG